MFKKKCHFHNDDGVWLSLVIFIIVNLRMMWKTMPIIIDKNCVFPDRLWWNKQSPPSRPRWSHIANTISLTCRFCVTEKLNAWYFLIHLFWIEIHIFVMERNGIFTSENNWIRKEWISDTTLEGRGGDTLCLLFYAVFSFMDVKKLEPSLKSSPLLSLTIKTSPLA